MNRVLVLSFILLFIALGLSEGKAAESQTRISPLRVLGKRKFSNQAPRGTELDGESFSLDPKLPTTISEALEQAPSVDVRKSGSENASPQFIIRGQEASQSRFFFDGVPLTDAQFHGGEVQWIPQMSVGRIDLYPSGVPISLSEDGLGGAMHFRLSPWEEVTDTKLKARAGSYQYTELNAQSILSSKIPLQSTFAFIRAKEDFLFFDDNGTPLNALDDRVSRRENNSFWRATFFPRLRIYRSANQNIEAWSLNVLGNQQVPGPTFLASKGKLRRFFQVSSIKQQWKVNPNIEWSNQLYSKWDSYQLRGVKSPLAVGQESTDSRALSFGFRSHLEAKLAQAWKAHSVLGTNWDHYRMIPKQRTGIRSAQSRIRIPIGSSLHYGRKQGVQWRPGLFLQYVGFRVHDVSAYADTPYSIPQNKDYFFLSPRVGLGYRWANVRLRSSFGRFFRVPSMAELYGAPSKVTPSDNLKAESAWKGEAGVDASWRVDHSVIRKLAVGYTFSASRASNKIVFVQNSQQTYTAQNVGQSRILSHEFWGQLRTPFFVSLRSGFTLMSTKNLSAISYQSGKSLPHRPKYRIQNRLEYRRQRWGVAYSLSVLGPSFWDLANTREMAATMEHSVGSFWDTKAVGVFTLELKNLSNRLSQYSRFRSGGVEFMDNTTGYAGFPAPGRRVYLSWRYQI